MSSTSTLTTSRNDAGRPAVMLLTPPGSGAIAVIRVTGHGADELVRPFLRSLDGAGIPSLRDDRIRRATFNEEREQLDDILVVARADAETGRVVDLCTHGGVRIVERIIAAFVRAGAGFRTREETLLNAWTSPSVIEREAWSALADAPTRRAVRWLLHARRGLPAALGRIAGVAPSDPAAARAGLASLIEAAPACRRLIRGATIAIVGPANAGKSSLANRLLGVERALVSPRAGTTLDWVEERTAIDGVQVTLLDTPGHGVHAGSLDDAAIARSRDRTRDADLILLVLDAETPPTPGADFHGFKSGSVAVGQPRVQTVLNKCDLPFCWGLEHPGMPVPSADWIRLSAKTGEGVDLLRTRIVEWLGLHGDDSTLLGFFNTRQVREAERVASVAGGMEMGMAIRARLLGPDSRE